MYAGTTISHGSGKVIGVHQKIDRVARRCVKKHLKSNSDFPDIETIIHFEGINGPDAIKRKSPSVDEPWHFLDPTKSIETQPIVIDISNHIYNLTIALKKSDNIKSAFEAAWLAHAIVDGLTPAHHYPMDDKVEELWGKPANQRNSFKDKNIIKGINHIDTISKNWEYWGANGVMTTHLLFEAGVASAISTNNFKDCEITSRDISHLNRIGFLNFYSETVQAIAKMDMYGEFSQTGWTAKLANDVKDELIPAMIKAVALAWIYSNNEAVKANES